MRHKYVFKFFLMLLLGIISQQGISQDYYSGDLRFGLSAAPNLSWFNPSTNPISPDGSRLGWDWGLNVDYFFSSNYAFSTGLHMLNYGGKLSYPDLYQNQAGQEFRVRAESDVRFSAVQLPLALKMRTSMLSAFNVFGKFGFLSTINYSRSEDYYVDAAGNIDYTAEDRDFSDDSRLINLSILVGAGVEYNISGSTAAFAGISFHQGILNQLNKKAYLTDDSGVVLPGESIANGPSGEDQKATINFISLDLGVFF